MKKKGVSQSVLSVSGTVLMRIQEGCMRQQGVCLEEVLPTLKVQIAALTSEIYFKR